MTELDKLSRKHKRELIKLFKDEHIGFPMFCYKRKYILISRNSIKCEFKANFPMKLMLSYGWLFLKIFSFFYKFKCPTHKTLMNILDEIEINIPDDLMVEILEEHNLYEYLI